MLWGYRLEELGIALGIPWVRAWRKVTGKAKAMEEQEKIAILASQAAEEICLVLGTYNGGIHDPQYNMDHWIVADIIQQVAEGTYTPGAVGEEEEWDDDL